MKDSVLRCHTRADVGSQPASRAPRSRRPHVVDDTGGEGVSWGSQHCLQCEAASHILVRPASWLRLGMLQEEMGAGGTPVGPQARPCALRFTGSSGPARLLALVRKQAQGPVLQLQWEGESEPGPRSTRVHSVSPAMNAQGDLDPFCPSGSSLTRLSQVAWKFPCGSDL